MFVGNAPLRILIFFFFNDTATTEIYTLSLHDALPISAPGLPGAWSTSSNPSRTPKRRSEEHTSELQSRFDIVCRLLLEKKKDITNQLYVSIKQNNNKYIDISFIYN